MNKVVPTTPSGENIVTWETSSTRPRIPTGVSQIRCTSTVLVQQNVRKVQSNLRTYKEV